MKKLIRKGYFVLVVVFFTGCLSSCSSNMYTALSAAAKDTQNSHNERYGSGSYSDAANGYSELAPQYSRINKLYDEGKITSSERDNRKRTLNKAYKDYKNGDISYSSYKRIEEEVVN